MRARGVLVGGRAALIWVVAAAGAIAAENTGPGAYCPLPEKGVKPQCLASAVDDYGEFFTALDAGEVSEADVERLERDVASGAAGETPYTAISSLSYGYFRLAQRAAANPDEDPAVVARLQRWNKLLAQAYDVSEQDPRYRAAVREAAVDLHERTPDVGLPCVDERGRKTECNSTEAVLRGFNRAEDQVGIRAALGRLVERFFEEDGS